MRIVLFVHSIVSDWNNGHAHFLRGLVAALMERGHEVSCCEPAGATRRQELAGNARETIRTRHNCDLRAEQLEHICAVLAQQVG